MGDLPDEFVERLKRIVPDSNWPQVYESFHFRKPIVVRINTLLTTVDNILTALGNTSINYRQISWKPDALIIAPEFRNEVLNSELYQQGLLYSQNLSHQLAPLVLNPQPSEGVLDMCAAPGGKTSQIACLMRDNDRTAAIEIIKACFSK